MIGFLVEVQDVVVGGEADGVYEVISSKEGRLTLLKHVESVEYENILFLVKYNPAFPPQCQ